MKELLAYTAILAMTLAIKGAPREPVQPFETTIKGAAKDKISDLVSSRLKRLDIQPAPLCSDAVFVRRVFLDAIGTLPTAKEAKEFITDDNPKKRSVLIDRLLDRKEFDEYWAVKWCDLLRVKSEYPINLWPNAVAIYHRWILSSLEENKPYDQFVREMLVANGSNFRVPQANFYRAVQSRTPAAIAQAVALTFMGVRPEGFSKKQWGDMEVFFSKIDYKTTEQWKEEIVFFNPEKNTSTATPQGTQEAVLPDGTTVALARDQDPREVFTQWLIDPKNPWFARSIVNRIWAWLMGRGIIHEPDDIRSDNPPENPELLLYLERELTKSHYDLKHIYRLILNSKVYQQSSLAETENKDRDAHFARYLPRRLEGEVMIDAICQITGVPESYSSPIPEPFTFIPAGQRSIELADGSISSHFLELFGRPARDTGMESERNNRLTPDQQLHLLNSSHIRRKIEQSVPLRDLFQSKKTMRDKIDELYLTILSRYPTKEELAILNDYAKPGNKDRRPMLDLTWALINSAEFLFRH